MSNYFTLTAADQSFVDNEAHEYLSDFYRTDTVEDLDHRVAEHCARYALKTLRDADDWARAEFIDQLLAATYRRVDDWTIHLETGNA